MARSLLAAEQFLDEGFQAQITAAAAPLGFTARFYRSSQEIGEEIREAEVLFGSGFSDRLREARRLRWYCSSFAGVEHYMDPSLWPAQDCLFSNSAGAFGVTISEHIVMVLLMLLRQMPAYQRDLARRAWTFYAPIRSIRGLRATILGMGDIGTHTARTLSAMGAQVRGVRRDISKPADPAFKEVLPMERLEEVLPETDALVLALPSTPSTRRVLDRSRLALLPRGAYVVNVGRGAAIDQDALMEARDTGALAGAALDVMEPEPLPPYHPLWRTKNLLLTPHCSGNTSLGYTRERIVEMFLEDLARYAAGQPLLHAVDRSLGY